MTVLEADLAVHAVAEDHVVVELHEQVTAPGPALELHVVVDSEMGVTIAWWGTGMASSSGLERSAARSYFFKPS